MSDFRATMAARSDAELVEIVTVARRDYEEDAVRAAEEELASRELGEDREAELRAEVKEAARERSRLAREPLPWVVRALAFFVPAIILLMVLGQVLHERGYTRKRRELVTWAAFGLGFYFVLALAMGRP